MTTLVLGYGFSVLSSSNTYRADGGREVDPSVLRGGCATVLVVEGGEHKEAAGIIISKVSLTSSTEALRIHSNTGSFSTVTASSSDELAAQLSLGDWERCEIVLKEEGMRGNNKAPTSTRWALVTVTRANHDEYPTTHTILEMSQIVADSSDTPTTHHTIALYIPKAALASQLNAFTAKGAQGTAQQTPLTALPAATVTVQGEGSVGGASSRSILIMGTTTTLVPFAQFASPFIAASIASALATSASSSAVLPNNTPKTLINTITSLALSVPLLAMAGSAADASSATVSQHLHLLLSHSGTTSRLPPGGSLIPSTLLSGLTLAKESHQSTDSSSATSKVFSSYVVLAVSNAAAAGQGGKTTSSPPKTAASPTSNSGISTALLTIGPKTRISVPAQSWGATTTAGDSDHAEGVRNTKQSSSTPSSALLASVIGSSPILMAKVDGVQRFLRGAYVSAVCDVAAATASSTSWTPRGLLIYGPSGCGKDAIIAKALSSFATAEGAQHTQKCRFTVADTPITFTGVEVSHENEDENSISGSGSEVGGSASFADASAAWEVFPRLIAASKSGCAALAQQQQYSSATANTDDVAPRSCLILPIRIHTVEAVFPNDDALITRTNMERLERLCKALYASSSSSPSLQQTSADLFNMGKQQRLPAILPVVIATTGPHGSKGRVHPIALSHLFADGISSDDSHSSAAPHHHTAASAAGLLEISLPTVGERATILSLTMQREFEKYVALCHEKGTTAVTHNAALPQQLVDTITALSVCLSRFLVAASTTAVIEGGVKEARYVWDRVRLSGTGSSISTTTSAAADGSAVKLLGKELDKYLASVSGGTMRGGPDSLTAAHKLTRTVTWDDIGGLDDVKQRMRDALIRPRLVPEAYTRFNVTPPKGVLLYGPPGCAKTTIVKALCSEGLYSFVYVDCASVLSSYVGESEQYLRDVFAKARSQSPCIVFFDEVDAVSGKRDNGSSGTESDTAKLLSTLLIEMDGFGGEGSNSSGDVCFVGATNLPQSVDSALLRPGRFDLLIHVPLPTSDERYGILRAILLKNYSSYGPAADGDDAVSSVMTPSAAAVKEQLMMAASDVDEANTISRIDLERRFDIRDILGLALPKTYSDLLVLAEVKERPADAELSSSDDEEVAVAAEEEEEDGEPADDEQEAVQQLTQPLDKPLREAARALVTITSTVLDGYSGADITAVVKEACTIAQRKHQDAVREAAVGPISTGARESETDGVPLPHPLLLLALADLQDAAANSTATVYDSAAIDAFAKSH